MANAHASLQRIIDANSNAILYPSSEAAITTETSAKHSTYVDLGDGYHRFDVYFDITCDVGSSDERYILKIFGSSDATPFGTNTVLLATMEVGALEVTSGGSSQSNHDRGSGEYVLPCHNVGIVAGVPTYMRYIKVGWTTIGTTPSLDFTAYVTKCT